MSEEPESQSAEELFESFVQDGSGDFDSLLEEHSDFTTQLRELEYAFRNKGAETEGGTFTETMFRRKKHKRASGTTFLREGQVLGDFRMIERLGRGGMGEVWEAEQTSLGRRVAFKALLPGQIDERGLEFFEREARAGARLNHAGIVSVLGTGHDDGVHWIAMELVEGGCTLADFIDEARSQDSMPPDYYSKVAEFAVKIVDALAFSHTAGVIHRDLKPANVLITQEDEPKVGDFGLARVVDDQGLSVTGDFAGTYAYMSPEQVMARRMGIDHRSDVFSMGVVLYELLALRRPFEGDTTHQVAEQIIFHDPVDPRTIRSKAPADLVVICGKAMAKQPVQRYQTMEEFALDLRRHLANEPIQAKPPSPAQRLVKWVRRNPTKSAAGAVAVVAFAVIAGLFLRATEERDRAVAAEELVERQAYIAFLQSARASMRSGMLNEAKSLHASCPEEHRGWEWRHMELELDNSLAAVDVVPSSNSYEGVSPAYLLFHQSIRDLDISPDGSKVALSYQTEEGDPLLFIKDIESDEVLHFLEVRESLVDSLAFSPDGKKLAGTGLGRDARIWDVETGNELQVMRGHTGWISSIEWSPDGEKVVTASHDFTIRVWDVETGDELLVLSPGEGNAVNGAVFDLDGARIISVAEDPPPPNAILRVAGEWDDKVIIWDALTGEALLRIPHMGVRKVALAPDGKRVMLVGEPFGLQEVDLDSGVVSDIGLDSNFVADSSVIGFSWRRKAPRDFAISPDGTKITAAFAGNRGLGVWDMKTGKLLSLQVGHMGALCCVDFYPDGDRILSGSVDGEIRTWSTQGSPRVWPMQDLSYGRAPSHIPLLVVCSGNGKFVTSGPDDSLRIWDPDKHLVQQSLRGHNWRVRCAAYSRDGRQVASGSDDKTVRVWNPETGECLFVLSGHEEWVSGVAFSPDGKRIVSCSHDKTIRVWSTETGAQLMTLGENLLVEGVNAVAYSPDGEQIVSLHSKTILIHSEEGSYHSVESDTASDPDMRKKNGVPLSIPLGEMAVMMWDAETGEVQRTIPGTEAEPTAMTLSPNGEQIVVGFRNGTKLMWDSTTGELERTFLGHITEVVSVAFNPKGDRILSAGYEGIRLWDVHTGQSLLVIGEDTTSMANATNLSGGEELFMGAMYREPRVAAFSSDGRRVISLATGSESTPKIWEGHLEDARRMYKETVLLDDGKSLVTQLLEAHAGLSPLEVGGAVEASIREDESLTPEAREVAINVAQVMTDAHVRVQVEEEVTALYAAHYFKEDVLAAVRSADEFHPEYKEMLLALAEEPRFVSYRSFNDIAWDLVDPDRIQRDTDVGLGLRLARAAVEWAPEGNAERDTLAWALFANGKFEEAVAASKEALDLARNPSQEVAYQGYLDRIEAEVSKASSAALEER
jgi:WD40 repeat protein